MERGLVFFKGAKSQTLILNHPNIYSSCHFISSSSFVSTSFYLMENFLGLLRIRVHRGINLAIRDLFTSDPYVVIKMGKQKLKTSVMKNTVNPEWNDELTLGVEDPNLPIKLVVFDKDIFTLDDKMGDAEFDIKPYIEAIKMNLEGFPSGTIIRKVSPSRKNYLSEESCIMLKDGKVVQDLCLRLRNVERGEVELQLQWIDINS